MIFLTHKREELHSAMAERWMKEIRAQLPAGGTSPDPGCGLRSGIFLLFFLAKEGHRVTGVDLTPDMIENAKILAAEENADCEFIVMDAENVDFPDGTFDVVISRNLTWTLPHVRRAYRELVCAS